MGFCQSGLQGQFQGPESAPQNLPQGLGSLSQPQSVAIIKGRRDSLPFCVYGEWCFIAKHIKDIINDNNYKIVRSIFEVKP